MCADMSMIPNLVTQRTVFLQEQLLKICQRIGLVRSVELAKTSSVKNNFNGNGGKKASITFIAQFFYVFLHPQVYIIR